MMSQTLAQRLTGFTAMLLPCGSGFPLPLYPEGEERDQWTRRFYECLVRAILCIPVDWAVDLQYYGDRMESPKGLQTSVKGECVRRRLCSKTMVDTRTECWESGQGPGSDEKETLTSALNLGTSTGDAWNRHVKEWKEPTKRLACLHSNEEPEGPALTTRHL